MSTPLRLPFSAIVSTVQRKDAVIVAGDRTCLVVGYSVLEVMHNPEVSWALRCREWMGQLQCAAQRLSMP